MFNAALEGLAVMDDGVVHNRLKPDGAGDPWGQAAGRISAALILDALDSLGFRNQALLPSPPPRTVSTVAVGRAKTLLWTDLAEDDPNTYEMELRAVDSLRSGDLIVCATGGSSRSGIWGELLTTAAMANGARGIVTDGAVRDLARIEAMGFPVFSHHVSPLDSLNRQKVIAYDVAVELGGMTVAPNDVVVADRDGVAIVPQAVEAEVLAAALDKAEREHGFRNAVRSGSSLLAAYQRFGVL
jgi:regulator of RNase E activity RraA